jgi:hypothetical protein
LDSAPHRFMFRLTTLQQMHVMTTKFLLRFRTTLAATMLGLACATAAPGIADTDLLTLDNGNVRVGIDRAKGGSITWLSWSAYPKNAVNLADPGRLIQQSYYAGKALDRTAEGQSKAWSPWTWNPIQGGGVGSWARVTKFERTGNEALHSETIPKLWDMPNEEAAAVMRQWTRFEPGLSNAVVVRCEFVAQRAEADRWGPGGICDQEIPACYFTRNFSQVKSYLGDGQWRVESQPPGPPWGQANPPRKAMAVFNAQGHGLAIFSPAAAKPWNFGPHGHGDTDNPTAGPCLHVAPLDRVRLGPKTAYTYRYWLLAGTQPELSTTLESLWQRHADERATVSHEPPPPTPPPTPRAVPPKPEMKTK